MQAVELAEYRTGLERAEHALSTTRQQLTSANGVLENLRDQLHKHEITNADLQRQNSAWAKSWQDSERKISALRNSNADLIHRNRKLLDERELAITNAVKEQQQPPPVSPSYHDREFSMVERRDLYQIRRRILVDKTIKVLKRRYSQSWPLRPREPFSSWSERVKYLGWERIAVVVIRAKREGNRAAHHATRAQLEATVNFALGNFEGEMYPEEGETLRTMFGIVYDGGEVNREDQPEPYTLFAHSNSWGSWPQAASLINVPDSLVRFVHAQFLKTLLLAQSSIVLPSPPSQQVDARVVVFFSILELKIMLHIVQRRGSNESSSPEIVNPPSASSDRRSGTWSNFLTRWSSLLQPSDSQITSQNGQATQTGGSGGVQTELQVRESGPSTLVMPSEAQVQNNSTFRLHAATTELAETRDELQQVKDALLAVRRENERLHQSLNQQTGELGAAEEEIWSLKDQLLTLEIATAHLQSHNSDLVESLQEAEDDKALLSVTNTDMISRIISELEEIKNEYQDLNEAKERQERHHLLSLEHATEMSKAERRSLHQIRRRILVDKTMRSLKKRYGRGWPMRGQESFYDWSQRVMYPGWERIVTVAMKAKKEGNKAAHQATRAQMQATVDFAWGDVEEESYPEEGEALQEMFGFVYDGVAIEGDNNSEDELESHTTSDWWS
ncbi:hypothetical protein DXG01_002721 [Tephrocybe rancida]|nr:hypothetical protein DXG01_002721 [Tephrocybe rancida]